MNELRLTRDEVRMAVNVTYKEYQDQLDMHRRNAELILGYITQLEDENKRLWEAQKETYRPVEHGAGVQYKGHSLTINGAEIKSESPESTLVIRLPIHYCVCYKPT